MGYAFLYVIDIALVIALVTLILIFAVKSQWKKVVISAILFVISVSAIKFISTAESKERDQYLNSWKSKEILEAEKQFHNLEKQSSTQVNQFIRVKLEKFIREQKIDTLQTKYNPSLFFRPDEINILEQKNKEALVTFLREENLIYGGKKAKTEIRLNKTELIIPQDNEDLICYSRIILRDSSTGSCISFFNRTTHEYGVLDYTTCYKADSYGHINDIKNELLFYSQLKKCDLDLRSSSIYWNHLNPINNIQSQKLFGNNLNLIFEINHKKYSHYRIFNWQNTTEFKIKPFINIDLHPQFH